MKKRFFLLHSVRRDWEQVFGIPLGGVLVSILDDHRFIRMFDCALSRMHCVWVIDEIGKYCGMTSSSWKGVSGGQVKPWRLFLPVTWGLICHIKGRWGGSRRTGKKEAKSGSVKKAKFPHERLLSLTMFTQLFRLFRIMKRDFLFCKRKIVRQSD